MRNENSRWVTQVLFLQTPYSHRGDNLRWHILNDMKAGMLPGRRPNDLSSHQNAIWDIISQCWDPDPLSRPRADGLNIPSTFIKPFTKRSTIRFFLSAKTMKSEKMEKQGDNHVASSNGKVAPPRRDHLYSPCCSFAGDFGRQCGPICAVYKRHIKS